MIIRLVKFIQSLVQDSSVDQRFKELGLESKSGSSSFSNPISLCWGTKKPSCLINQDCLYITYMYVLLFWAPVIAFVFFSRYPSIRCHEYSAGMSVFDSLFRNLILTSQFVKGWGQPSHLKRLMGGLVEHAISSISFVFHFKFKHYIYLLVHFIDMMSMYIYIFKLLKNNVL